MKKTTDPARLYIIICENKGADQLYGNRTADQHLCFRCIDSTITLLSKSEKSQDNSPLCVGPGWKPLGQIFSRPGMKITTGPLGIWSLTLPTGKYSQLSIVARLYL